MSRDEGSAWGTPRDLEDDPSIEFTNVACSYTREGKAIVTYLTSQMENPEHPGRLGRAAMSLKGAIFDIEWLYA